MVRKDELEFDILVPFLREETRVSPKDADFPATSPGTRYEPYRVGKSGVNANAEERSRGSESTSQRMWVGGVGLEDLTE